MDKMKVKFWGVRGSIATPGMEYAKYGGNTSCVELRCGNRILIFDAGTGMRQLGRSLVQEFSGKSLKLHLFISHTHWDHIQGFPFLEPAYIKDNHIIVYGGHSVSDIKKLLFRQMEREYFPITLFELASKLDFVELRESPFLIDDDIKVHFTYLIHPGLSLGFRVEYNNKVFVYATDNELLDDPDLQDYNIENFGNLIVDADVVVADSQYTAAEYTKKVGWGHSSIEQTVKLCNDFRVKNYFSFHHDPWKQDDEITKMLEIGKKIAKEPLKVFAATEKDSFTL